MTDLSPDADFHFGTGGSCCGKPVGCNLPLEGCKYPQHPWKRAQRGEDVRCQAVGWVNGRRRAGKPQPVRLAQRAHRQARRRERRVVAERPARGGWDSPSRPRDPGRDFIPRKLWEPSNA